MSQAPLGPPDLVPWPSRLRAHVVDATDPSHAPRLHGFDLHDDLARHYRFTEVAALALAGDPLPDALADALEVALVFLAGVSIAEAPVHAAALAGLCGARPAAVVGTAALGLAERAADTFEALRDWLEARAPLPERFQCADDSDRAAVARLSAALPESWPAFPAEAGLEAALYLVLHRCGLRSPMQVATLVVLAGLPAAAAEAAAVAPGDFMQYPTTSAPEFTYEPPARDEADADARDASGAPS